jgi:hypothetical protein
VLGELGVEFMVYKMRPLKTAELTHQRILRVDERMRALGLKCILNNEQCNWQRRMELEPGKDEFAHPGGVHRWDLRMEWLRDILEAKGGSEPAFMGVNYDEAEHMLLTRNQFATSSDGNPSDVPFLVETNGMSLEEAFDRLVEKCVEIREKHYEGRVGLWAEHVWPDTHHLFARAGWTIAPKLLKENLSSVVMAVAMGAALEYAENGADFWVTPDLWYKSWYPGHTAAALRSAMMMGYWLGADAMYVENLDWQDSEHLHPDADPGSFLAISESGEFQLTKHGRAVSEFYTKYIPEYPREVDWRDYRPKVAIVRLPDGAWGQSDTWLRDTLLGNAEHPMDEISAEWLQVWPILTHGVARDGAISTNNLTIYPETTWKFFVPIDSVAVFDHLVTGPVLDSVECFIVCGHAISADTFADVAKRVEAGARCIIPRRLFDAHAISPLRGNWVVVNDFTDPAVPEALQPFLVPPDVARFRFANCTVEFRPGEDWDDVSVDIIHPAQ